MQVQIRSLVRYCISLSGLILLVQSSGCFYADDDPPKKIVKIDGNIIRCLHCEDFGDDIEIAGDLIAITGGRSLYLFDRNTDGWNLLQEINYDTVFYSRIQDIELTPSLLAIGLTGITGNGSVYLFERNPDGMWAQFQELKGTNDAGIFGHSIHILNDRMIIGSPDSPGAAHDDRGQAYIYKLENETWVLEEMLESNDHLFDDHFGTAVRLIEDYALVSRDLRDEPVQVFKWNGTQWNFHQLLPDNKGVEISCAGSEVMVVGTALTAFAIENGTGAFTPRTIEIVGDKVPNDMFHNGMHDFILFGDKEFIEVYGEFAFVSAYVGKTILFRRNGPHWSFDREFNYQGDRYAGNGLALTDQYIAWQSEHETVEVFPR